MPIKIRKVVMEVFCFEEDVEDVIESLTEDWFFNDCRLSGIKTKVVTPTKEEAKKVLDDLQDEAFLVDNGL